ncbi:MAG: hypothetical protein ACJA2E_000684 [Arenicella sp.]|jgi:hypothetical protein
MVANWVPTKSLKQLGSWLGIFVAIKAYDGFNIAALFSVNMTRFVFKLHYTMKSGFAHKIMTAGLRGLFSGETQCLGNAVFVYFVKANGLPFASNALGANERKQCRYRGYADTF